jgi:uncharacterized integral membrane protein
MRAATWAIRLILFFALLAFAAKNTGPVVLRFYFDTALEVPLVLLAFGFFAAGVAIGVIAVLGTVLRQRREILRLKRESRQRAGAAPRVDGEPGVPGVPPIAGM